MYNKDAVYFHNTFEYM